MDAKFREHKDTFLGAKNFREVLTDILEGRKKSPKATDYEIASWPYFQADQNGYNRALEDIMNLLKD